jgi:hypothetical protein
MRGISTAALARPTSNAKLRLQLRPGIIVLAMSPGRCKPKLFDNITLLQVDHARTGGRTTEPPKNARELVTLNVAAALAAKEEQKRESAR